MFFKIVATVLHIATGYTVPYVDNETFLSREQCVKAIPAKVKAGRAKAARIAKKHGLDGDVIIQAQCVEG